MPSHDDYPRVDSKGYLDDGHRIGPPGEKCWGCGSDRYYQTVSVEHCPSCGLRCDYWGGGSNLAYDRALARKHDAEEREAELRRWREEQDWYADADY